MAAKVMIEAVLPDRTGAALAAEIPSSSSPIGASRNFITWLTTLLAALVSGLMRGRVRVGIDESTGVKAAITVTVARASMTAGDVLVVNGLRYTAVATTPVAGDGTFAFITTDDATATSLAAAITTDPRARGMLTAAASTSTVVITAAVAGSAANAYEVREVVTNAAAFVFTGAALAGGVDAGAKQSLTAALGGALTANDTVTIGAVVLTAKASPSGESEFAGAVSAAADGAALAACINAHSKLKGLFYATGTSTVTIQLLMGGRVGNVVGIAKSAAQITLSAATFAPSTTEAYAAGATGLEFGFGSP
jgi:hypothetical protein